MPYIRLIYEVEDHIRFHTSYTAQTDKWDSNVYDVVELFRGLLLAAGFMEETVKAGLNEEECHAEEESDPD